MADENQEVENVEEKPENGKPEENVESGTQEVVPKQELQHVLNDMMKHKREANQFKTEYEKLQAKVKEMEENNLSEKEDFKTLYERAKEDAEQYKNKYGELQENIVNSEKVSAVEKAAIKLGVRDEALEDLSNRLLSSDKDEVEVEATTNGRMLVHGVEGYVSRLKEQKPHWFKGQSAARIDNSSPTYRPPKEMTTDELLKLRKDNPTEYKRVRQKLMQQ